MDSHSNIPDNEPQDDGHQRDDTRVDAERRNDQPPPPRMHEHSAVDDRDSGADAIDARQAVAAFFQALLGDGLAEELWAHLWWRTSRRTKWIQKAPDALHALAPGHERDVYCGIGLAPRAGGPTDRVKVETAAGMFGVVADIDIASPVHKKDDLPPDYHAAQALLDDVRLAPTLVVDSGHGIQAWWLFPAPWRFANDTERQRGVRLGKSWQDYLKAQATMHGWTIDSVGDLARVLRVPGTLNAKDPADVVPVRLLRCAPALRHTPEDIERHLATQSPTSREDDGATAHAGDATESTSPTSVPDDTTLIQRAISDPRHGVKFVQGFVLGNTAPWKNDDSTADMAIAGELAYWCGPDPARIDRLFRRSALYRTPGRATKWDEIHYASGETYGHHLIATVLKDRQHFAQSADWDEPVPLPDEMPAVSPCDPTLLPAPFRPWLEDCALRIGAPLDFFGAPAMALAGSLIGRQVGIHPKRYDDWIVVANLWGALVGLPSTMKTPALREVMKTLSDLLAEADEQYQKDHRAYEVTLAQHDAQVAALKDLLRQANRIAANPSSQAAARANAQRDINTLTQQLAAVKASTPQPPVKARYKTEDTTIEKLGELLMENPNGLLLHRDELMGWLRVLDDRDHGKDRAFYLEAWEGLQGHEIDRIGRGSFYVPAVCMAVMGGIQPGPLSAYVRDALGTDEGNDGFLQRFQVLVWPDALTRPGIDAEPDKPARATAYSVFHALPTLTDMLQAVTTDDGSHIPAVHFDPDAQDIFDDWNAGRYARLAQHDLHAAFEAHLTKYRSLMPSLALIYQVVNDVAAQRSSTRVGREAAETAIRWCDYLETHAHRLYGAQIAPEVDGARSILRHIRAGDVRDGDTMRKVYLKHWRNADTPDKAHDAMRVLEEYGWARMEKVPSQGGAPAYIIRINPQILVDRVEDARKEGGEAEMRA